MTRHLILPVITAMILSSCSRGGDFVTEALDYCVAKTEQAARHLESYGPGMSPRNIAPGDSIWTCRQISPELWTEGFWPGVLWKAYEASGSGYLREKAEEYTRPLQFISARPAYDHDVGFIIFTSFGNGWFQTENPEYRETVMAAAGRLAELYNPAVGTMLSWPREVENFGGHNTILDNLINLETLFWAAENGGPDSLKYIAVSHADTTMRYNFREDGSSIHVSVFNPENGNHLYSCTHQGSSDESMWARGQAWGIYGYTMCYRYTQEKRYLEFAEKVADIFLSRLPEDHVPYWDFDDPSIPDAPRDASAAAIVSSALVELSSYVDDEKGGTYMHKAEEMLKSLYENYRSADNCDAFLLHSTGHYPAGSEVDYSIIYADYYFIEGLLRLQQARSKK